MKGLLSFIPSMKPLVNRLVGEHKPIGINPPMINRKPIVANKEGGAKGMQSRSEHTDAEEREERGAETQEKRRD